jgi:hypothetical protein
MASACGHWVLYTMDQLCISGEEIETFLDMLLEVASSCFLFTSLTKSITMAQVMYMC